MLPYDLAESFDLLARTPAVLRAWLGGLPDRWRTVTEGPGTWSPYDVVGHLIHGERADWVPRVEHMLHGDPAPFTPFDREAMFTASGGKSLEDLLEDFARLRGENLTRLRALGLAAADLDRPGLHPALGPVTLRQHLACWVAHDWTHLAQIARVLAKQYREEVGPWRAVLGVLADREG
jgi:hypothetical protein